jgi:hypothetical protein
MGIWLSARNLQTKPKPQERSRENSSILPLAQGPRGFYIYSKRNYELTTTLLPGELTTTLLPGELTTTLLPGELTTTLLPGELIPTLGRL